MIQRSSSTMRCWLCVLAAAGLSALLIVASRGNAQEKSASKAAELPLLYEAGFEDMPRRVPDISKIRELVGYEPKLGLDEIIRTVISHMRDS